MISRRDLLRSGGALVVGFAWGAGLPKRATAQGRSAPSYDLDSFLAIHADGTVTISTSHVDPGTGIAAVYRQIAAEELDIPVSRFKVVQGDTDATPDHGGTGGSSGVPRGGADIRQAAATARRALLDMAAKQLDVPAAGLTIVSGQIRPMNGGAGIGVAKLIGGKQFSIKVDPSAPVKSPAKYTVVGTPVLRSDLPTKATGRHVYAQDQQVPGMLHARVIRPAAVGARLLSVDESSVRGIPDVRLVRIQNFLGVVAKDEWAAIRAARELKVSWSQGPATYSTNNLDTVMAGMQGEPERAAITRGDAVSAIAGAARQLSATYYWPFHSHASLGPSCAVADVRESGTTIWSSTQNTYGLRSLIADTFGVAEKTVRVIYLDGSGSYGSNGAFDAAADAFLLSRAVGQPVRVQWMRQDEHAWDPKGPAQLFELRGALDKDGNIAGWESKTTGPMGPRWTDMLLGPVDAGIAGEPSRSGGSPVTQNLDPPYAMANLTVSSRLLPDTPMRTSNLRAPGKIGTVFAVESFTDELAAAAGTDPVAFRRRGLEDPRALAVLDRAAKMIGWKPRPSPAAISASAPVLTGRGIAYIRYKQEQNYIGMAMEVAVERATGKIHVQRIACAHDCGLIINPDGLRNQVEGNILQTLSRTLHEEVIFDSSRVTSVDWVTYPILKFPEVPPVEVELINHSDQPAYGAGEAACAPVAAALANAIFDATGVRLRRVPFTPARVKAALA